MRALEYSDQDVLEIATGFRLHVLDQVSLKQALISLTDKSALLRTVSSDHLTCHAQLAQVPTGNLFVNPSYLFKKQNKKQ